MIKWWSDLFKWLWYWRWRIWYYVWRVAYCLFIVVAILKNWLTPFQVLCLGAIFFMLAFAILHWHTNDEE